MSGWHRFRQSRTASIALKETRHILRDPFTLAMALGMPLIQLIFFGFAIDFDVKDIKLTVIDQDRSRASRQLVDGIRGTGLFLVREGDPAQTPSADLDHEKSKGVLIIKHGFAQDLRQGEPAKVQLLLDGADNSSAGVMAAYISAMIPALNRRLLGHNEPLPPPPANLRIRFLFNPELNSRWFIIPGLSALIMGMVATMLTAVTIAREWEQGSMELLLSTPVKPLEIIVGKLLPYLILGMASVFAIWVSAIGIFGLPFEGNIPLYFFGCLLFLIPCLAIGLMISVKVRQQQAAMQMSMMISILPSMLLSGFIYPIESMPIFFKLLTAIIPARWFIMVSRGLFLKGESALELALPFGILILMNIFFIRRALAAFKTDLEP